MTSATARGYATHILTENADLDIPGYRIEREFGPLRVWRLEAEDARIRDWVEHRPNVAGSMYPVMRQIDPYSPTPPVLSGCASRTDLGCAGCRLVRRLGAAN